MRLSRLLAALPSALRPERVVGDSDAVPIRGLRVDSRAVVPGDLFVALRGMSADGHDYLDQALELGAVAVLVEKLPERLELGARAAAVVPDTRRALAHLAACFYGRPSEELDLIGVTGTNGKTSTTYLLESMLLAAGRRAGLIGTVEVRFADERWRPLNTTPESLELQRTLRAMRTQDVEAVAMEVSSHGLAQGRIEGCRFAAAGFTNVTQDHLDFHGTMEEYRRAKTRLFREYLQPGAPAVINLDDPSHEVFAAAAEAGRGRVLRATRRANPEADVWVEAAEVDLSGTRARLRLPAGPLDVELPLIGEFNLENLAVAAGVAVGLGLPPEAVARGAARCRQVPGRVERVGAELPGAPTVLVDYAHTPDALDKLLRTVRPLAAGRLIAVFGCGGDRDRGKRPQMGEAAASWCDHVVLTSDNPRTENPQRILTEIETGLTQLRRLEPEGLTAARPSYAVVPDRRAAIELALSIARPEDTVVIAGKGHEDYQIVGHERLPFDDRVEALRALRRSPAA